MDAIDDPLTSPPPAEVHLERAPLVRVIAQVRFPEILAVEHRELVAPFQQAIRSPYPVLRREQSLGPFGASPNPQTAWRFSSADTEWRLSLSPGFLALETASYTSRGEFMGRLRAALVALEQHLGPQTIDRLGVRYIDRITGPALADITRLIRPELRGILGSAIASHAELALSESLFECDAGRVLARWGLLPADATADLAALEAVPETSWILDLDLFRVEPRPFSVDGIITEATRFSERIYAIFRWAVTEEFLRKYGGLP
jgi:uncharacterized protein (TIGR04255 family)